MKRADIVPMTIILFSVIMLLAALLFGLKYGVLLVLYLDMDLYAGSIVLGSFILALPFLLLIIWLISFVWILNRFYRPGSV